MNNCIFCKIAAKKLPSKIQYEDEDMVAFDDIAPKALVHILIVPKKHIESIKELENEDTELMGKLILVARKIAQEKDLKGYKLLFNVGKEGGQLVDHIHLHLLSGQNMRNAV